MAARPRLRAQQRGRIGPLRKIRRCFDLRDSKVLLGEGLRLEPTSFPLWSAFLAQFSSSRNRLGINTILGLDLLTFVTALIVVVNRLRLYGCRVVVLRHDRLPLFRTRTYVRTVVHRPR
jgi:hypothetical protein